MSSILYKNNIYVKKSKIQGYGVFAGKKIKKGERIEQCYFVIVQGKDKKLDNMYFDIKKKNGVILGYGSIYNHQDNPNATYTFSMAKRVATFKATRDIKKDEEIFISYGDEWFSSRKKQAKTKKAK